MTCLHITLLLPRPADVARAAPGEEEEDEEDERDRLLLHVSVSEDGFSSTLTVMCHGI